MADPRDPSAGRGALCRDFHHNDGAPSRLTLSPLRHTLLRRASRAPSILSGRDVLDTESGSDHADGSAASRAHGRVIRALLRVPLFHKILIANAAILALAILGCGLMAHAAAADMGFAVLLGAGLALSVATNALILRFALRPLADLQATAQP